MCAWNCLMVAVSPLVPAAANQKKKVIFLLSWCNLCQATKPLFVNTQNLTKKMFLLSTGKASF